jgi:hypothetical protein
MKTKIQILITVCSFVLGMNANSQTMPGEIAGEVTDGEGNPLPGAVVSYTINGALQGTATDGNGRYRIKPLDAGTYNLKYSLTGFDSITYKDIKVSSGQITALSVKLSANNILKGIEVVWHEGLFRKDVTIVGGTFDPEIIDRSIMRTPQEFVATVPAVNQKDDGQEINIRGSRSDATQYYVDGVKMIGGFSIPKASIKEIQVITGGLPAMFGDATGGVVLITTWSYWDYNKPQQNTEAAQADKPVSE